MENNGDETAEEQRKNTLTPVLSNYYVPAIDTAIIKTNNTFLLG